MQVVVLLIAAIAMGDEVLVDFERDGILASIKTDGTRVRKWPSITLLPPDGTWDLSEFQAVTLEATNQSAASAYVGLRVDNPGADGANHCVQVIERVPPGETVPLRARLLHPLVDRDGTPVKLFGMRGFPGGGSGAERPFDPANVTQIVVFLSEPTEDHSLDIGPIHAAGTYASPIASIDSFFPMIDEFGQYRHIDWPGKTHSVVQMQGALEAERQELAARPRPDNWDEFGGWEDGPTLEATGFFRAEKHEGKWWLVDPLGKLFVSHGVDCVGAWGDHTPIEEREHFFSWLPEPDDPLNTFRGESGCLLNYYAGRRPEIYDFTGANMARKYGLDNRASMDEVILRRLPSWGLNTIANWSDPGLYLKRKMPYVVAIHFQGKLLEGSEGYWGKFRDVFDPSFRAAIDEQMAAQAETTAGDPWCIGYFVDNEIAWGNDTTSLAIATLRSPSDQRAKRVFLEDLRAKYESIEALNEAWGTEHESWRAMLEADTAPEVDSARDDLEAFYAKTAQTYFRTIRDAVRAVAPEQLYLGCRFAWANPLAADAAAEHCDVVSYNMYTRSVTDFALPGGHDVPVIIGEFHFGALDRGMFHPGLVEVADQAARGEAYKSYVYGMLENPNLVGCHWFKYRDEPTTGRTWDDENYHVGLIDVCDTPYVETVEAIREAGTNMYEYRADYGNDPR